MNLLPLDLKILALLQGDARLTIHAIAAATGASAAACQRHLTKIEAGGVIAGYRAVLDAQTLGLVLRAFVFVRRSREAHRQTVLDAILALPEVVACHVISGEHDFLLEIVARDMQHFADATLGQLAAIPGIVDHRTTFAISSLRIGGPLPIAASV
jgi:Lrp/AsnC family leucine-responsive transcriptional regulator